MIVDKSVQPHDDDIEMSILATCFIGGGEVLLEIIDLIEPQYFYKTAHKLLFDAILDVANEAESADCSTVAENLKAKGLLEKAGGVTSIMALLDFPIAIDPAFSCKKLEEKFLLRRTIELCYATVKRCTGRNETFDDTIDFFVESAHKVSDGSKAGDPVVSLKQFSMEAADVYEERYRAERIVTGVPTGISDLDMMTFGQHPGDLTLLAGRPGMGKTATVLNWAKHAAEKGIGSLIVSLEMPTQQLFDRLVAMETGINGMNIRIGNFNNVQYRMVNDAIGRLFGLPIYIDDRGGLEFSEIRRTIRRQIKTHPEIKIVYIDHMQLVRGKNPQNRNLEIGEISSGLKALAKELRIPIVALSQLNRELERRSNPYRRPRQSDLRDSGSLEQDADNIIFVYRPWEYGDNISPADGKTEVAITESDYELIVAKQRQGQTGTVHAQFYTDCQRVVGKTKTSPDEIYQAERKKREKQHGGTEQAGKDTDGVQAGQEVQPESVRKGNRMLSNLRN
jgi:replicative DNA helicase